MSFTDTLKKRRSVYVLGRNIENEAEVVETIETAIKYSPTAFNSQSHRAKILLGAAQDKLWGEIVPTALEAVMKEQGAPEEAIAATKEKLAGFQAGYGTVLFFEDQDVVNKLKVDFAFYADKFDGFSAQATGIVAANTWSALADLGVGANLQHYNPVIDAAVAAAFNIPASYKLESQLVFGSIEAPAGDKDFVADDIHFEVIK